ncbi:hypothetical protein [Kitasatospora sp. NPDC056184]
MTPPPRQGRRHLKALGPSPDPHVAYSEGLRRGCPRPDVDRER